MGDGICFFPCSCSPSLANDPLIASHNPRTIPPPCARTTKGSFAIATLRHSAFPIPMATLRHYASLAACSSYSSSRSVSNSDLNPNRSTAFSTVPRSCRRLTVKVKARGNSVEYTDRLVAALGYFLPFLDGVQYGRYLFMRFPVLESMLQPLFPLLQAYKSVPYANFVLFFSLYLAVVRNPSFSRYVRFNTMQAVVLDVLLTLPIIIERILSPRRGLGIQLLVIFYNSVFVFLVSCFVFGVVSCLLGKTPRLPFVADAADAQI
ncbi:hypothetical protein O6H91_05G127700 [Diphasiastrum complanatum]|uniref:Uncharacterized protein n=1 Tax=Diphasiastrum complanatum TaxID=34168 RepID=A0ACC2DT87_DIPCM|nr:hypothetical protein O6H91_Y314900 [Diphasiastrum complanatum]KAJ7557471.1 hypothetical protein O6H91_05G127700 [Diphasiastrum complanatum]